MLVSDHLVETYKSDGAVLLKNMLDQSMLDALRAGVEYNLANPTVRQIDYMKDDSTGEHFFHDQMLVDENPHYKKIIFDSPIAPHVAALMQSEKVVISNITVFLRSAGTQRKTRWHRDQPYWPVDGWQCCSTWIPLDPVARETALEFVKGSHHWPSDYARENFRSEAEKELMGKVEQEKDTFPDIEARRNEFKFLQWEVEPGDCIMFHGMTAHGGSGQLPPGMARRVVSLQWFGDDIRFAPRAGGVDPDFLEEIAAAGVKPGMPMQSDICPVIFSR
ncbi:MAG: phytanoyl-CoA dioxygenase family protein [Pseudomonadota bacterium]